MKKNIAVIGCGHWGKNLVRNFSELGVLNAVCDPNKKLADYFAKEYSVNNLSFDQINNSHEIDGVVLAVPAPLHASMSMESMNCGKHVYVEKPLAMNLAEAQKMIVCAKKNNVKMMVGHLLQYHPIFISVKEYIKSNEIGSLLYIYSNRLSLGKVRSEEDVIWSFAPHDISMILSLVEDQPNQVRTETSCILQPNIPDTATLYLDFKSNVRAHISVSWLNPIKEQKLVVIGNKGMVVFDDTKPWHEKFALYRHRINQTSDVLNIEKSEVEYIHVEESEPLKNECKHFIDIVNQNIQPYTDGNEGLNVLKVLTEASISKI